MAERCINLNAAEARAWAAGATALIRPAKPSVRFQHMPDGTQMVTTDDGSPPWQPGDVLIGREAFRYPDPQGDRVQYEAGTWTRLPANWLPAIRMPKSLARHRRRVVSVRVCRAADITPEEADASGMISTVGAPLSMWVDGFLGATGTHPEAWVSVTMLDRSANHVA